MITGIVTDDGTPIIEIQIAGQTWTAIIDTGFNSFLELPDALRPMLHPRFLWEALYYLAAGQTVVQELYEVQFPFDGVLMKAEATFVAGNDILLGTAMLRHHRLEINFPSRSVLIERV